MDLDDDIVTTLRRLGDLLSKASAEDLKSLLAGQSKIVIVPKSWKPVTAAAKAPPAPSTPEVRAQLLQALDSGAQRSYLESLGLNQAAIRKLATGLGAKGASKLASDEVIDKIVAYFRDATPASAR